VKPDAHVEVWLRIGAVQRLLHEEGIYVSDQTIRNRGAAGIVVVRRAKSGHRYFLESSVREFARDFLADEEPVRGESDAALSDDDQGLATGKRRPGESRPSLAAAP
jgi:hypothetical protein